MFFILFSVLSATLLHVSQGNGLEEFQITDLEASNLTQNLIDFSWTLPANSSYDNFSVVTLNVDKDISRSENISKYQTTYRIDNLEPGTTIRISINTIIDSKIIASYSYAISSQCDDVKNVKIISITDNSVFISFSKPSGYYNYIMVYCSSEDSSISDEYHLVGQGVFRIGCFFLPSGSRVGIALFSIKQASEEEGPKSKDGSSPGLFFSIQTVLGKSSIEFTDISGIEVDVSLSTPIGFFDYLELDFRLLSTDSKQFFVNPNISRPECASNTIITKTNLTKNIIKMPINFKNICPLSYWNVTVRTIRQNFESVEVSIKYRNGYQNVDCKSTTLKTIGNKTTFYWPESPMKVNIYHVSVAYAIDPTKVVFQEIVPFGQNNLTVFGLENNKDVIFAISAENTEKNITSMICLNKLTTGEPCSTYDKTFRILKYTAPYPDSIRILVPSQIFTSPTYIENLKLLVSTSSGCLNEYQTGCYLSLEISVRDFYSKPAYVANLPLVSKCYNSSSCNLTFGMDRIYYFILIANGPCGRIYSNVLVFEIPSPFPLATIVGSIVGTSIFIVVFILTIIVILTVKHINKKHKEDLALLLTNVKHVNDEEILQTWF